MHMDLTTTAAIIGSVSGVMALLMYLIKVGEYSNKIKTLWNEREKMTDRYEKLGKHEGWILAYSEELKAATKTKDLGHSSEDLYLTKKGEEILPPDLKEELKDIAESQKFEHIESVDDAVPLIIEEKIERLRNVSATANVSTGVAAMVASLYALKVRAEWVDENILKLKDEHADVRSSAAEALGRIGDTEAVEPIIPTLKDMDRDVRWKAVEALGRIGGTKAAEELTKALGDEYEPVGFKALEALVKIGAEAVEPLIKGLKNKSIRVRYNSAAALGRIGSPKAKDALTEVSNNDKSKSVRSIAKDALKKINAKQGVKEKALFQALADEKWEWRTVGALVRESGMAEEAVYRTLEKHKKVIMKSSITDRYGNELYTLQSRYIKTKRSLKRKLSFIAKKPF